MTLPAAAPIASQPRYATLQPRSCSAALMIADTAGARALVALAARDPALMPKAQILFLQGGADLPETLTPANVIQIAKLSELDTALAPIMANARMGLQVWLAGSKGLIAQAQAILTGAGLPFGAIQAEHCGSLARRMQCVHCKTIADGITIDPYLCPGCGRALYVRDHFSRRLGAFQGVCIDAETPGIVPEPQEIRL